MVKSEDKARAEDGKCLGNNAAEEVQFVNLTIKVQRHQRLHWLIEAKKQRTSLTAAIVEALNARFGDADEINSPK